MAKTKVQRSLEEIALEKMMARHAKGLPIGEPGAKNLSNVQIITFLNTKGDFKIQKKLITNRNVPIEYLRELLFTPLPGRVSLWTLPIRPLQALIKRLPDGDDREVAIKRLEEASVSKNSRRVVARYINDPARCLEYCYDEDPETRLKASRNKATPEEGKIAVILLGSRLTSSRV
jgi:hypothetical protein